MHVNASTCPINKFLRKVMNEWITKKNSFNFIYLIFIENGVNFHGTAFAHRLKIIQ